MTTNLNNRKSGETLLFAIVDTAVDGIIIIDQQGIVRLYSAACERMFGYREKEVVGKNVKMLMPQPYRKEHDKYLSAYAETGDAQIIGVGREVAGRRKDGSEFPMWLSVGQTKYDDQPYFVGILHDITEQKAVEEQLRIAKENAEAASRARSDFLAVVSHEIRGPVHGISATNNLLAHTDLDDGQQRHVQSVQQSSAAILELVDRIFYLSKIEMGLVTVRDMRCRLEEILKSVEFAHRPRMDEKDLEFFTQVARDVPPVLSCDADKLREIIGTLLDSAIRFTEDGYIALKVSLAGEPKTDPDDSLMLRFEVKDTGTGVEPELQGLLFEHAQQGDFALTRKQGRFGLGLSICKQLCRLLGGEIGVTSSSGKGCSIWFTVACTGAEPPDDADVGAGPQSGESANP